MKNDLTRVVVMIMLFAFTPLQCFAIDAESLENELLQTRYVYIISELRCLVCQNQSIQDSNAPLAKDLRRQVRTLLLENRSDQEILAYMVERYGDYVRYRPPLRWSTAGLWIAPVVIALLGLMMLISTLRKHLQQESDDEIFDQDGDR